LRAVAAIAGAKVEVAGSEAALRARQSDTSQELLGKFSVFTGLQDAGNVKSGIVVNITDEVTTMGEGTDQRFTNSLGYRSWGLERALWRGKNGSWYTTGSVRGL